MLKKETVIQSAIVDVTLNADVFFSSAEDRADEDLRNKVSGMLSKRKREMPVRVRIHSSFVSTSFSISALVSFFSGR